MMRLLLQLAEWFERRARVRWFREHLAMARAARMRRKLWVMIARSKSKEEAAALFILLQNEYTRFIYS
ncbi:MAG: hypothetical protein KGL39_25650 [Patescibacteria group bacterium]|nr:hypothetical protein [Patescibacteria group bacterium]